MTRVRTVRLPADVPLSAVSVDGTQKDTRHHENGTTSLQFTGILRVNGQIVLSPGQLLSLWMGQAVIDYEVADATLLPDASMPAGDVARISAYAVGANTALQVRQLGYPDEKVAAVLELAREKTSTEGRETASTPAHHAQLTAVDSILGEMITAWRQALMFEWSNDD
ncbi:hypothetical protein ACWEQC_21485 [Streptomyces shenzhenensis]